MTDFLRSILQTAHNANVQHSGATTASTHTHAAAAAAAVKTEVRPVDQIQVPPSACVTADASASLLAMEKQRMIKVEIPETTSSVPATNVLSADAGKAQRAARRDVVNARRETKRKTMSASSPSPSGAVDGEAVTASATSSPSSVVDMTASESATVTVEKSKKMKTGKTTSASVSSCVEPGAKSAKKSAASSPSSSSSNSFLSCGSMLFGSEIDALGEERLRQMELQLESLDPDSKEAKKKRRLIRNRMSAQLHRERKKAYVGQLEDQLMEKERELKALQEKLDAFAKEQQLLQQKLQSQTQSAAATVAPIAVAAPAAAMVQIEDDVVIKTEPIVDVASAFEAAPTPTAAARDNWDYCFSNLEDTEMADVAADDLLRDFDHPFAAYTAMGGDQQEMPQQHHEIHAAKKNLVMVMGMMFSATFFGNSPFFFDVQSGSNYSSFFNANPPKEFSQMNIASKIMSSLEKSSWKDFRDIASWTQSTAASAAAEPTTDAEDEEEETDAVVPAAAVASSPSAASDITDSSGTCDSPAQIDDCLGLSGFETDLIDEFVYPVDDPFAPALADTNWFGDDADDFGQSDVDDNDDESVKEELFLSEVHSAEKESSKVKEHQQQSITSRLFEKLTTLWHEKNQVLLTVVDGKNEVTSRSVADMSSIRKSMENGSIFSNPLATAQASGSGAAKTSPLSNDQSVSFLYPLSAFSPAMEEKEAAAASDVMFLEVSCQMSALSM